MQAVASEQQQPSAPAGLAYQLSANSGGIAALAGNHSPPCPVHPLHENFLWVGLHRSPATVAVPLLIRTRRGEPLVCAL